MKVLGITAEYNPFHKGHLYHMERSREITEPDCVVVCMSGDFTQRGEAAIADKWQRSRMAVEEGADLVVELPFIFACNRGSVFARGAVDILRGLGAGYISFGSEAGRIEPVMELARAMEDDGGALEEAKNAFMGEGYSYARGMQLAVEKVLGREKSALLDGPNNILALEYTRRILYWNGRGDHIEPVTVERFGSGYFGKDEESGFSGASEIRSLIEEGRKDEALSFMTEKAGRAMKDADGGAGSDRVLFDIIRSVIASSDPGELRRIYCMGEGLENRLIKEVPKAADLRSFVKAVSTRRYTESTVRRLLMYMVTGVREKDPSMDVYARVLAAGDRGRELLRSLRKQDEGIPVITNINKDVRPEDPLMRTLRYDIKAADIYSIIKGRDMYGHSDKVLRPYIKIGKGLE